MISKFRRRLMIAAAGKSDGNINYPGLIAAWSAKGKSNEDADRNILRDLTGNGHDIVLNNFAFSEMSGYGGYNTDFTKWGDYSNIAYLEKKTKTYIKIKKIYGTSAFMFSTKNENVEKYKITGLVEGQNIKFGFAETQEVIVSCESDGIYTVDWSKLQGEKRNIYSTSPGNNYDLIISLVPEYPDALVFDGVDDYGINEEMPILTDYTLIVKRVFLDEAVGHSGTVCAKGVNPEKLGAFVFERNDNTYFNQTTFGNGYRYSIDKKTKTTWQNTTSYLGNTMVKGSLIDESTITLGTAFARNKFFKGAFYSAYLFDRSLDEQEIKAFIRKYIDADYLLPSEQTTE